MKFLGYMAKQSRTRERIKRWAVCILITATFFSCQRIDKFNREKWREKEDATYLNREFMIKDLTTKNKLTGMRYTELKNLLGRPDQIDTIQGTRAYYNFVMDYGSDIDPIHTKNLVFELNDSLVVESFKIVTYKKE